MAPKPIRRRPVDGVFHHACVYLCEFKLPIFLRLGGDEFILCHIMSSANTSYIQIINIHVKLLHDFLCTSKDGSLGMIKESCPIVYIVINGSLVSNKTYQDGLAQLAISNELSYRVLGIDIDTSPTLTCICEQAIGNKIL